MQVEFLQNLGLDDIRKVKDKCGVTLDPKECTIGKVTDLPTAAADLLAGKYKALFKPANKVRGEVKQPEVTAPAK